MPSCTTPVVPKPSAVAPHAAHTAQRIALHPPSPTPSWQQRVAAGTLACVLACAPSPTLAAPPLQPQPIISHLAESSQQQLSFEISVDGESIGRVTVALFDDVPVGTQRFAQLAAGIDGASYRRSKFNEIYPEYIRNAGVKNLTYRADAQVRLAGGADTFALESELAAHLHQHDQAGVVSIVVRDAEERYEGVQWKDNDERRAAFCGRLASMALRCECTLCAFLFYCVMPTHQPVSQGGQGEACSLQRQTDQRPGLSPLCNRVGVHPQFTPPSIQHRPQFNTVPLVQEVMGEAPNGTAFVITRAPAPALDATNLPIGRVVDGLEVVEAIGKLPVVKDNSDSPFFKAGKVLGDRRADVAERSFNRPFNRVVVAAVTAE